MRPFPSKEPCPCVDFIGFFKKRKPPVSKFHPLSRCAIPPFGGQGSRLPSFLSVHISNRVPLPFFLPILCSVLLGLFFGQFTLSPYPDWFCFVPETLRNVPEILRNGPKSLRINPEILSFGLFQVLCLEPSCFFLLLSIHPDGGGVHRIL